MGNGDQAAPDAATGFRMTPEFLAALAEGIGEALGKQPLVSSPCPGEAVAPDNSAKPVAQVQAGQEMAGPLPVPVWIRPTHRLVSRKFWVTVSTVATLMLQNPIGLNLPPAAQIAAAAVAAIYVAAQAIVDSAKQGGGNG